MLELKETLIVLTPGFPDSDADTTCLPFLQTHINAINKCFPGLEIKILTFQYPFAAREYSWHGNEVVSFGGKERGKLNRLLIWYKVWMKLIKLKKSKKVIGLFSLWCTECALIGSYFGKLYGVKHHVWLCGQDAKAGNKYVKLIRPGANELIAMSDFLKREFSKNYNISPGHVIPLGVDPKEFTVAPLIRDIYVLGVGSLIPLKQYDIFVKITHRLAPFIPGMNAVICGAGPEKEKLDVLISELKLNDQLKLAGEIPHSAALHMMQRAKIFLHTSNYEGFGTVCLEALFAGAHVVSFTKPMDIDVPHWHHVNNEEEMTARVKELLQDRSVINESVEVYSSAGIARAMMKLYDR